MAIIGTGELGEGIFIVDEPIDMVGVGLHGIPRHPPIATPFCSALMSALPCGGSLGP